MRVLLAFLVLSFGVAFAGEEKKGDESTKAETNVEKPNVECANGMCPIRRVTKTRTVEKTKAARIAAPVLAVKRTGKKAVRTAKRFLFFRRARRK